MELSNWPQIPPINQKNYYTYVKLDLRLQVAILDSRLRRFE